MPFLAHVFWVTLHCMTASPLSRSSPQTNERRLTYSGYDHALFHFQQVQSLKCVAYLYQLYSPNMYIFCPFLQIMCCKTAVEEFYYFEISTVFADGSKGLAKCLKCLLDTGGHLSCQQFLRGPDVAETGSVGKRQRWTEPRGLCEERPASLQVTEENRERWRAAGVVWKGSHWAAAAELRQKSSQK